jgi:hypothetical protein
MCTLPESHALNYQVEHAYNEREKVRANLPPMRRMATKYDLNPKDMEKIGARNRPPTYKRVFNTRIDKDRDESIEQETADTAHIRIYTDGSAIGGKVGAAALLHLNDEDRPREIIHYHLGPKTRYSTYNTEWVGLLMATWLLTCIDDESIGKETASVYVNNQSVIKTSTSLLPGPAQHIRDTMLDISEELRARGPVESKFTIKWISAHSEVSRNK